MKRFFTEYLLQWRDHPLRAPLVVRGARQVGKTFSVEFLGKEYFKNAITINLEIEVEYHSCFEKLDPHFIVSQIELLANKKITPGESLLFLDEIQQCPKALHSLRYFKERLPELHVIAAGSLLEFAIHDEDFSFPVGRIQFAKLYPMSFEEYLLACQEDLLQKALVSYDFNSPPSQAVHDRLISRLKEYAIIGGMPAAIRSYLKTSSFLEVKRTQKTLIDAFEADFGKYAKKTQHRHLKKIFMEAPRLLGEHIKYSRIDPDLPNPAREIKNALELLRLAGLVLPVTATSAGELPLLKGTKVHIFKLLFLDIGLVGQMMGLEPHYPGSMAGPLAEQLVGQELLSACDPFLEEPLFFWTRNSGSAEIDYLFAHRGVVYPIEVKSGKAGKLKSLRLFLEEKKVQWGIKVSQEPLAINKDILSIPLYMTSHLCRLLDQILSN